MTTSRTKSWKEKANIKIELLPEQVVAFVAAFFLGLVLPVWLALDHNEWFVHRVFGAYPHGISGSLTLSENHLNHYASGLVGARACAHLEDVGDFCEIPVKTMRKGQLLAPGDIVRVEVVDKHPNGLTLRAMERSRFWVSSDAVCMGDCP